MIAAVVARVSEFERIAGLNGFLSETTVLGCHV